MIVNQGRAVNHRGELTTEQSEPERIVDHIRTVNQRRVNHRRTLNHRGELIIEGQ